MSLETDPNTKKTDQISMLVMYQVDSTDYIKGGKELKPNLFKKHTIM